jgi:glycosyltransferase involved in cell wall biosynthesis
MISIIIPTYNRSVLVMRAIKSVLNQTNQDFEIIVVDDGSTDQTQELFEKGDLDTRIRYFRFSKNKGVHEARNYGIDVAKGDIIAFLDSDDEWYPQALNVAQQTFDTYKDVGLVSAPLLTDDGELTGMNKNESQIIPFEDQLCSRGFRRIKGSFISLRRNVVGDIRWKVQYLQFIFYRHVAKNSQLYFYAEPLGIYHMLSDENSITKVRSKRDAQLSIKRAGVIDEYLDEFGETILKHCPCRYGFHAYGASVGLLLAGKKKKALIYIFRAVRYTPRVWYVLFLFFALLPGSSRLLRLLF